VGDDHVDGVGREFSEWTEETRDGYAGEPPNDAEEGFNGERVDQDHSMHGGRECEDGDEGGDRDLPCI